MTKKFDFSGYATKYDLKCTDGRTIRKNAFKDCDGKTVPLVWKHLHDEPGNVLGHALLECRDDGVYAYASFNQTANGIDSKHLVEHGDISFLSIYANQLEEQSKNVTHGMIREVSLVVAGANPGAQIDNLSISHADGSVDSVDDEAIICMYDTISLPEVAHSEENKTMPVIAHATAPVTAPAADATVGEIFDTLTDVQKEAVYALIAEVADAATSPDSNMMNQSDEGDDALKHNIFDNTEVVDTDARHTLTHDQFAVIMKDAAKSGSLKEAILAHVDEYGITNIDYLFPDARVIAATPAFIQRQMAWVSVVMNGTFHSPFSRIKSLAADITADSARALGYVKGNKKKDEIISLLRRTTTPTTIYKKQKLDRDDVVDITDFDVVAWLKAEMRVMLDEECARAILVSDGRASDDEGKIDETKIRPIWKDDEIYVERVQLLEDADYETMIEEIIKARKNYRGSGTPTMFVSSDALSGMLLLKDTTGRRLYATQAELETVLRVSSIVEVPVMANLQRTTEDSPAVDLDLVAIIVNLKDYTVGADKGGAIGMFDNFDIDYNQYKYLMESRVSGALVLPKSAIVVEQVAAAG